MNVLMILNDPPYGTERSYNALRLAGALAKRDGEEVKVFLMGDAVGCAMANQKLPEGYYHIDRMILAGTERRPGGMLRHVPRCSGRHGGDAHRGRTAIHARGAHRLGHLGR